MPSDIKMTTHIVTKVYKTRVVVTIVTYLGSEVPQIDPSL